MMVMVARGPRSRLPKTAGGLPVGSCEGVTCPGLATLRDSSCSAGRDLAPGRHATARVETNRIATFP